MERPKHAVFAWDTFQHWPAARMRADAEAFVGSAAELFTSMLEGRFPMVWPSARAAAFMFAHGVELFLKAMILQACKDVTFTHDLDQLHRTYRNLYPGNRFELPGNVEAFTVENRTVPFEDFLKYPEDIAEVGSRWDAGIYIDVAEWKERVVAFGGDLARLWSEATERYPDDLGKRPKP